MISVCWYQCGRRIVDLGFDKKTYRAVATIPQAMNSQNNEYQTGRENVSIEMTKSRAAAQEISVKAPAIPVATSVLVTAWALIHVQNALIFARSGAISAL